MKKIFVLFAMFLLMQSAMAYVVFDYGNFKDVTSQNVEVFYLANKGIVQGNSEGYIELDRALNRAEALTLYARFFDIEPTMESECSFSDVTVDKWYTGYVLAMCNRGMINGYPDGTFRPANTMNRAEALKILGEGLGVEARENYDFLPNDVAADKWYTPFAYYFVNRNIAPLNDGNFEPEMPYKRGDLIRDLYRLDLANSLAEFRYSEELDPVVQKLEVGDDQRQLFGNAANSTDAGNDGESFFVSFFVGDADDFGVGLADGVAFDGFIDGSDDSDDAATDRMLSSRVNQYSHKFMTVGTIKSARLEFLTYSIQDAEKDGDLRLYLDGVELPGAFDDVNQEDENGTALAGFVSLQIPEPLLTTLDDGEVVVKFVSEDANDANKSGDSFALDYSKLILEFPLKN